MNTSTIEKTSTEPVTTADQAEAADARLHRGPIARLLASVSRLAEEHAAYKLSKCDARRISLI